MAVFRGMTGSDVGTNTLKVSVLDMVDGTIFLISYKINTVVFENSCEFTFVRLSRKIDPWCTIIYIRTQPFQLWQTYDKKHALYGLKSMLSN